MFWKVIAVICVELLLFRMIVKREIARKKNNAQAASAIPASAKKQPDTPVNEEALKPIQWIPAESVSEGGTYYEPLMLEYKGIRYINEDSDPMFLSKLIEAEADKRLVIPDGITGIGVSPFQNFPQLEEIVLPDSVKKCFTNAFADCANLKSVTLPSGLTELDYGLFRNCKNLKSITIPDTVKGISWEVFSGCDSLETVELPDSVSWIGKNAFANCTALREITLPASMSCIAECCFDGCTGLSYILLKGEKNDWHIDESAFSGCTCDIFVEAPSFDEEKLAQHYTSIEQESGMWWEEYHFSWHAGFSGNVYFAGQWHYDENGKPVKKLVMH